MVMRESGAAALRPGRPAAGWVGVPPAGGDGTIGGSCGTAPRHAGTGRRRGSGEARFYGHARRPANIRPRGREVMN